ncbi:alkaline phosphatase PafA [Polluticoccus soli]|uniref:alkaline phosphatase PafA n=1 Tax=Polluticoccus soli TaxID=3034150 RepID=UPI0023E1A91C|nr:alkaline phosphatase PafA [Flavipsychrobacter sp. JY13-12]
MLAHAHYIAAQLRYFMRHFLFLFVFLASVSGSNAQNKAVPRPKLVVGIVVDQMRWDYLYRYYDRYTEGGFKRLMSEGFNCQNTMINYLPSFTGPGHACVYTGSVPSIHGIAANDWLDNITGKYSYCAQDDNVRPVGGSVVAGKMSPKNLMATTVTDELKLATNSRSKVFGVAIKDRGSILPAGHMANGAYWFDDSTGNFVTSSFYGNSLPEWLNKFNLANHDTFVSPDWSLLYPLNTYKQSVVDDNRYEGPFPGERAPIFPHSVKGFDRSRLGYYGLRYLPYGNTMVFNLAKACINEEKLGQSNDPDFLCVSFSSTDYAGHRFGPNSVEMEDMFLRFDIELAEFLKYLDRSVGKGEYTLFLTADHGAAHNPTFMQDMKISAGSDNDTVTARLLNSHLKNTFGVHDTLVRLFTNYQVYLNESGIARLKLDRTQVKAAITDWLGKRPGIAYAIDMELIGRLALPEPIREMAINGYNRKRSGVIQIISEPGWFSGDHGATGTTHGSWNPYDTHIPLLWYGWGIAKGETHRTVYMTDIAPTLAALLKIQMPSGNIGKVIAPVMKR